MYCTIRSSTCAREHKQLKTTATRGWKTTTYIILGAWKHTRTSDDKRKLWDTFCRIHFKVIKFVNMNNEWWNSWTEVFVSSNNSYTNQKSELWFHRVNYFKCNKSNNNFLVWDCICHLLDGLDFQIIRLVDQWWISSQNVCTKFRPSIPCRYSYPTHHKFAHMHTYTSTHHDEPQFHFWLSK